MNSGSNRFDAGHKQSIPADVDVDELLKNVACDEILSLACFGTPHEVT